MEKIVEENVFWVCEFCKSKHTKENWATFCENKHKNILNISEGDIIKISGVASYSNDNDSSMKVLQDAFGLVKKVEFDEKKLIYLFTISVIYPLLDSIVINLKSIKKDFIVDTTSWSTISIKKTKKEVEVELKELNDVIEDLEKKYNEKFIFYIQYNEEIKPEILMKRK